MLWSRMQTFTTICCLLPLVITDANIYYSSTSETPRYNGNTTDTNRYYSFEKISNFYVLSLGCLLVGSFKLVFSLICLSVCLLFCEINNTELKRRGTLMGTKDQQNTHGSSQQIKSVPTSTVIPWRVHLMGTKDQSYIHGSSQSLINSWIANELNPFSGKDWEKAPLSKLGEFYLAYGGKFICRFVVSWRWSSFSTVISEQFLYTPLMKNLDFL